MTTRAARTAALLWLCAAALGCGHTSAGPASGDAGPDGGSDAGDAGGGGFGDGGSGDGGSGADGGAHAVHVRAIYPGRGPAAGGTLVLVVGDGFVEGFATGGGGAVAAKTSVAIGGALATGLQVIDDNRLQLTTPAGTPGAADVAVLNPNGTGTCAGCFRYVARIAVEEVVPALGSTAGGTAVALRGEGFSQGVIFTVGGRELIQVVVQDANDATGLTPPGSAGPAEVRALEADGEGSLFAGFVYADPLRLDAVAPAVVALAGGPITLSGAGFSAQAAVAIDGLPSATTWVDAAHLAVKAPAHAPGAVDVKVTDSGALPQPGAATPASANLLRGLVYVDASAAAPGPLALLSLAPRHGPLAGGTCPAVCLHLVGSGLSLADLRISIGGTPVAAAAQHVQTDHALDVDLPAAAAPGPVDVSAASAAQGTSATIAKSDLAAFHYDATLSISGIAPAAAPASGSPAVSFTLLGAGFSQSPGAPLQVLLGALPASAVSVAADGRSLGATAPAGAPGPADATVIATDLDGTRRSAVLPAAFNFTAPLALAQVLPGLGAQAGGTQVSVFGRGFDRTLALQFGGKAATLVRLQSPSEAVLLTPPGNPGAVDVSAAQGTQAATLPQAFTYFDPASASGGAGGGPLLGTLNVSVLEGTPGLTGGVAQATVTVQPASGAALSALTDARGQVTFSDLRLALPCDVTATKPLYDAFTVREAQAANLTVYLSGPPPPPPPPPNPPPPPPPPPVRATIAGHVYGFKAPPSLVLQPWERLAAYVYTAADSIFAAPPYSPVQKPIVIASDGGGFQVQTTRLSPTTFYALFGVEDTRVNPLPLRPLLLGVHRDVQPDPSKPANADIILDTHLDQSVTAQIVGPPLAGEALQHQIAIDLDLGSSGLIPLAAQSTLTATTLTFTGLPAAQGQGFVFVDLVTPPSHPSSVSSYLRRVFGDLSGVVPLGPYLPFPLIVQPAANSAYAGVLAWTESAGLPPNLAQVSVYGATFTWSSILPGTALQTDVPAPLHALLAPGSYSFSVTTSLAPTFDYAYWTYDDLYGGSWTAYAYDTSSFTVVQTPP